MGKSSSQEQKKKLEIVFLSTACKYNYQLQAWDARVDTKDLIHEGVGR